MTSPTTPLPESSPWELVIGEGPFSERALHAPGIGERPFLDATKAGLKDESKGIEA